jgi:P-type Mg2+ transporter
VGSVPELLVPASPSVGLESGAMATGVGVAIGADSCLAAANRDLSERRGDSAFERGVKGVSWTLIWFMVAIVPVVLAVNELVQRDWLRGLFALAVATGLTPEMLPVVVTSALARATTTIVDEFDEETGPDLGAAMRRHGVIVKRLPAGAKHGA